MDRKKELGAFLRARRGQVAPDAARLPFAGDSRRVPGLRREEVAWLAGISDTYYTRLERGQVGGISDAVLRGLVDALQLSPQEADYIASAITVPGWVPLGEADDAVPETVQRLLDGVGTQPIHVLNERCDIVATNAVGRLLYPFHHESAQPNSVRFLFTDPRARTFFVDWEQWAHQGVAYLRSATARHPGDRLLTAFITELVSRSPDFAASWESHDVHYDPIGVRSLNHPDVGRLDLDFQALTVVGHPLIRITAYSAPAGSPTHERLVRLAGLRANTPTTTAATSATTT